ncbi:MAG: polysaccharide biosynthesis/export family protein, partial [Bacteroidales bacterium]
MANPIRLLTFILFCGGLLLSSADSIAQSPLDARDLSTVRSENVSNAQLMRFIEQGEAQGVSVDDAIQMARLRGLPASEAETLARRIRELEIERQRQEFEETGFSDPDSLTQDTISELEGGLDAIGRRIFGARLFSQEGLTFEPSMNVPTPVNYELGPGDEIVVDIWGEATNVHRLEVSNQGTVTIENLGPIYVHGLSISDASDRIIEKLRSLYRGLRPGSANQTVFARVHLGQLRSIQVTVMGEVRSPGNYTLSSLATVFNALYNSQGPNNIGSYRSIKVIRGNEVAAELDVYDLLIHGNQIDNIRLRDQDIIKV